MKVGDKVVVTNAYPISSLHGEKLKVIRLPTKETPYVIATSKKLVNFYFFKPELRVVS